MGKRINFIVPKDLAQRFSDIPWGQRSLLLRNMVEICCILWETQGSAGLAIVLDGGLHKQSVQRLDIIEEGQTRGQIGGSENKPS